jgi:ribonuclease BN (tRNA processing enzyme)
MAGWLTKLTSRPKTTEELEEETERAEAEDRLEGYHLSIAKKRQVIAELKTRGLGLNHFRQNGEGQETALIKAWRWLKTH